jgi:hypothetical protein
MDKLISDCARAETIKDIIHTLLISDWQIKPYQHAQNFAENRYATSKTATNPFLNSSGAPADCFLLALQYNWHFLKHFACATLKWLPLLQVLTGQT